MRLSLLGSVAFATSLVLVVGAPTDPVSAADRARIALAERTVAEALEASGSADREALAAATEPESEPIATGTIDPGVPVEIEAAEAAATVEFSGFEVEEALEVTVSELADAASVSAEAELGATVVSAPIDVSAVDGGGAEASSFPADAVIEEVENGPDVVTEVTPGVALEFVVDEADVAGLDPASLRIVTREEPGSRGWRSRRTSTRRPERSRARSIICRSSW